MDSSNPTSRGQSPATDRRHSSRHILITSGILYREGPTSLPQTVMLKDVSDEGVGFESSEEVEPGTTCRISIQSGPMQIAWRARVVFCGKVQGGDYCLGGQFLAAEEGEFGDSLSVESLEPMLLSA
jgi:hypothetical protein